MPALRTTSAIFNEKTIHHCVLVLIYMSQWFAVTPLPDGKFEVEVKEENKKLLTKELGGVVKESNA